MLKTLRCSSIYGVGCIYVETQKCLKSVHKLNSSITIVQSERNCWLVALQNSILIHRVTMRLNCLLLLSIMALFIAIKSFLLADQYLFGIQKLIPSFNIENLFDGPFNVSSARIATPIKSTKPTREEMIYYNYYTTWVYAFEEKTMECGSDYCSKIRNDVSNFVGK